MPTLLIDTAIVIFDDGLTFAGNLRPKPTDGVGIEFRFEIATSEGTSKRHLNGAVVLFALGKKSAAKFPSSDVLRSDNKEMIEAKHMSDPEDSPELKFPLKRFAEILLSGPQDHDKLEGLLLELAQQSFYFNYKVDAHIDLLADSQEAGLSIEVNFKRRGEMMFAFSFTVDPEIGKKFFDTHLSAA